MTGWLGALLDGIAGFAVALLAGLGVGGGGLYVLWLTLIRGVDQLTAQGVNLVFFILASTASVVRRAARRPLPLRLILALALPGVIGTVAGAAAAAAVDPSLLRKCFGALMILSGIVTLRR